MQLSQPEMPWHHARAKDLTSTFLTADF